MFSSSCQYFSAYEDEPNFAKNAFSLEDIRYESPELCPSTYPQMGVFYRRLVQYDVQVKGFLDVFGPDQVHIFYHQKWVQYRTGGMNYYPFAFIQGVSTNQSLEGNKSKKMPISFFTDQKKCKKYLNRHRDGRSCLGCKSPLFQQHD